MSRINKRRFAYRRQQVDVRLDSMASPTFTWNIALLELLRDSAAGAAGAGAGTGAGTGGAAAAGGEGAGGADPPRLQVTKVTKLGAAMLHCCETHCRDGTGGGSKGRETQAMRWDRAGVPTQDKEGFYMSCYERQRADAWALLPACSPCVRALISSAGLPRAHPRCARVGCRGVPGGPRRLVRQGGGAGRDSCSFSCCCRAGCSLLLTAAQRAPGHSLSTCCSGFCARLGSC